MWDPVHKIKVIYKDFGIGRYISHDQLICKIKPCKANISEAEINSRSENLHNAFKSRFKRIAYEEGDNNLKVLFEGEDPSVAWESKKQKYFTTGRLKDILKEQEEIVKIWIKKKNEKIKSRSSKLKYLNIKVDLRSLFDQLTDLDSKYNQTKQILLELEKYVREKEEKIKTKDDLELLNQSLKKDSEKETSVDNSKFLEQNKDSLKMVAKSNKSTSIDLINEKDITVFDAVQSPPFV